MSVSLDPIVIPIRFVLDGRPVQTTSRSLGPEGVFVRSAVQPPLGAELFMKLHLPGSTLHEEVLGAVRSVCLDEGEEGFFAEFVELAGPVKKRIEELISRSRPTHPDGNARAHARHTTNVKVRFATAREFVVRYAHDISAGGIFVRTSKSLPKGEIVKIQLELPDGGTPVEAEAVVARCVTPAEAAASGKEPGLGLQFVGGNDGMRARIDAFIERLAAEPCWADEPPAKTG